LAAHEAGASVAMVETAPREARAGNSAFTGGAFRFVYQGIEDLLALDPTIADLDLANIDFGTYTTEQYFDDMGRLTDYRCDPDLTEVLIGGSYGSALWLKKHGVKFQPALGRQAFKVGGKFKFWGRPGLSYPRWRAASRGNAARRAGEGAHSGPVRHDGVSVADRRRPHPGSEGTARRALLRTAGEIRCAGLRRLRIEC
jgi:hypothetical protein